MAAGVKRRAQPDGLAAELQLQPCGFGRCLPPGEKPQAQFYRRAADPGQCQQQQRRNTQVDRQICRIRHAGAGAQDDEKDRPRQRNVQRRVPAGRRHQPPPAPPAERCRRDAQRRGGLVRDLHGYAARARTKSVPRAPPVRCPPASGQTAHAGRSAPPPPAAEGTPSGNSSAAAHRDTPPF